MVMPTPRADDAGDAARRGRRGGGQADAASADHLCRARDEIERVAAGQFDSRAVMTEAPEPDYLWLIVALSAALTVAGLVLDYLAHR